MTSTEDFPEGFSENKGYLRANVSDFSREELGELKKSALEKTGEHFLKGYAYFAGGLALAFAGNYIANSDILEPFFSEHIEIGEFLRSQTYILTSFFAGGFAGFIESSKSRAYGILSGSLEYWETGQDSYPRLIYKKGKIPLTLLNRITDVFQERIDIF